MTTIRPAFEEDAETLARLGADTFIATFGSLYAQKDLDAFLVENHSVDCYREILNDPDFGVWLADADNGEAIGYAVAGPCGLPVPNLPSDSGELSRIYLTPSAQGGGVGGRLLEAALDFLTGRFEHVYLSVYAKNFGAHRLYQRYGFVKIHDYFFKVGEHLDPEWIMEQKKP